MSGTITTSYVSGGCPLPPLVAQAALRGVLQQTPLMRGDGWELRLAPDLSAELTAGWGLRAAVDVEVEPWSRDRVALGLRHRSRNVPWWRSAYFDAAHDAVRTLTTAMVAWADEPLRALLDDPYRRTPISSSTRTGAFGRTRE